MLLLPFEGGLQEKNLLKFSIAGKYSECLK